MNKKELNINDCNGESVYVSWYPNYRCLEIENSNVDIITIDPDLIVELRDFLTEIIDYSNQPQKHEGE